MVIAMQENNKDKKIQRQRELWCDVPNQNCGLSQRGATTSSTRLAPCEKIQMVLPNLFFWQSTYRVHKTATYIQLMNLLRDFQVNMQDWHYVVSVRRAELFAEVRNMDSRRLQDQPNLEGAHVWRGGHREPWRLPGWQNYDHPLPRKVSRKFLLFLFQTNGEWQLIKANSWRHEVGK